MSATAGVKTDLVRLVKVKTHRGKIAGYRAHLGAFEGVGATAAEAREDLARRLAWYSERQYRRTYVHTVDGPVFALYATPGGWNYDITRPGGRSYPSSCLMGFVTDDEARRSVDDHAAQSFGGIVPYEAPQ